MKNLYKPLIKINNKLKELSEEKKLLEAKVKLFEELLEELEQDFDGWPFARKYRVKLEKLENEKR